MTTDDEEGAVNLVQTLRHSKRLTRVGLAAAAGVPISAVRRMEHRRIVRLNHALKVARALEMPADTVFEPAFQIIGERRIESEKAFDDLVWNDEDFRRTLGRAGIDPHPAAWMLKIHFLGGEERVWSIFSSEVDRFWNCLDSDRKGDRQDPHFFVFDGDESSVAVNLSQMAYAHALYDGVIEGEHAVEEAPSIEILLAGEREWMKFDADLDEPEHAEDIGSYQGQLSELLTDLDLAPHGDPYVAFNDGDGERVVFNVSALAAISVVQEVLWGMDDGHDSDEAPDPSSETRGRRRRKLRIVTSQE